MAYWVSVDKTIDLVYHVDYRVQVKANVLIDSTAGNPYADSDWDSKDSKEVLNVVIESVQVYKFDEEENDYLYLDMKDARDMFRMSCVGDEELNLRLYEELYKLVAQEGLQAGR